MPYWKTLRPPNQIHYFSPYTLWEDDTGGRSKDQNFDIITQFSGGNLGKIQDGGVYFDGNPGKYEFTFTWQSPTSGVQGVYEVGFTVA